MSPSTSHDPRVTLFIPTWNAGREFPDILRLMREQELDRPFEIVAIDSGSTDGTLELLEQEPVRLLQIPNREFNHGLTRNRGIQEARGEIVVLATQDARPFDQHWMQRMVDAFDDPEVAGAYSRQIPRPDANPFIRDRLGGWAAAQEDRCVQQVAGPDEFARLAPLERYARVAFDNVSSSVRRAVALEFPFRSRKFGEDIDWAHRVILAGHKIVFEPRSAVVHSHNNSIWYEFKRIYLDHQNLHRTLGVHTVPRWRDLYSCTLHAWAHLFKVIAQDDRLGPPAKVWWWIKSIPYGLSQNLAQFLGARSVKKIQDSNRWYVCIDRLLRRGV
ncbi:MAG: glycosyltransferase [Planctomycetota bacterium]